MKRKLGPDKNLSTSCLSGWLMKKKLHPCAIQFCDKWKYGGGLGFEITLPFLITPGTWSETGVRTLTVLHDHDNRESPFHRQTRSKSWPWQKALVPTVSFNTEFYERRDTQSWGLCISLHQQPMLYGYTLAEFRSVVKDTKSNTKYFTKSISIHSDYQSVHFW